MLARLQQFDPPGVFARSLAECLALQLRDRDRLDPGDGRRCSTISTCWRRRDLDRPEQACGVLPDDLPEMIAELKALNPKPGLAFAHDVVETVVPDIFVLPTPGGGWRVELNAATLPKVLVNTAYHTELMRPQPSTSARKEYLGRALPVGELAGQGARSARPDGAQGRRGGGRPAAAASSSTACSICGRWCCATSPSRDRTAREHGLARHRRQVRRHAARQLPLQVFLLQCAAGNQWRGEPFGRGDPPADEDHDRARGSGAACCRTTRSSRRCAPGASRSPGGRSPNIASRWRSRRRCSAAGARH